MAQARYNIRLQSTAGITVAVFDDILSLDYELKVNDSATCTLVLDGNDPRIELFKTDSIIQIWRKPDMLPWYKEAELFHRSDNPQEDDKGVDTYTSNSVGLLDLLHRREILYTGITRFTQKAGSGEGVMKDYVRENAGELAGEPLRKANGITQGLFIAGDLDQGTVWRGERGMRNLLDVLQEIALATKVDFDIVRLNNEGIPEFMFITGYPQIGRDLTQSVFFDTKLDNMISPSYTKARVSEANVVAILGPGDGTSRIVIVSESLATNDSPWNRIEVSQNSSNQSTIEELFTVGEEQLVKLAAQESFLFQAIQTDSTQYGVHYRLGDRVTARYKNIVADKKLTRVHVSLKEGKETIQTEFADIVVGSVDPLYKILRNLNSRIKQATNIGLT